MVEKSDLIIVSGKKQAGKDTSIACITKHLFNVPTVVYNFADPLKEFLVSVFGLRPAQCYGTNEDKNTYTKIKWVNLPLYNDPKFKEKHGHLYANEFLTARQLMQIFGSDICREMYPNCWVEYTKNKIMRWTEQPEISIIGDTRFPNELDCLLELNPLVIRLLRNPFDDDHVSEKALDDYDFGKFKRVYFIDNKEMTLEEKNLKIIDIINNEIL